MNRVYKVVRNAGGEHIAVAESAKSAGKTKSVALVAAAIISAVSLTAQANTLGIQTGINDIAMGSQATSTGKNNIAIGAGSFAAGGTLTEAEANQLIADSKSKINQISSTQASIAQKEKAIEQYLQTVEKVERNQAEIERLTKLNNIEKGKTGALQSEFDTANGIYIAKQAEVDTKVSYLEKLDLNKYGALNETSLSAIAKDVKSYIEQGDTANSLGDQFYKNYVSAYVDKVARLDYIRSLSQAAATMDTFYNEKTQSSVSTKSILGDAAAHYVQAVTSEKIPTTPISFFESALAGIASDKAYFNANKDSILDNLLATNSQISGMYSDKREELVAQMNGFYQYHENEHKLAILTKQTGVMPESDPKYLQNVNEIKRLKAQNSEIYANVGLIGNYQNSTKYFTIRSENASRFIGRLAEQDGVSYSADKIAAIRDADTNQAQELKNFLTDQIASVKKRSDDAQSALSANQALIANYEKDISNRQPTPEELLAYQKAKAEEAALIAERDKLKKETDELKAIQASLEEGKDAVALGANSKAIGDGAVALGANNDVLAANGVALGTSNSVTGAGSVAIGAGNTVSGTNSIAVGTGHQVTGSNSGAFGDPSNVSGNESYAYGNNNTISGDSSHVMGNNSITNAVGSFVIGNNSIIGAAANNSLIFGSDASSTVAGGIAIGNNSVANRINSVSIGSAGSERQLINVGNATANTDAVNLGQMNAGLALKADKTYVDTAIGNIPILDISGKADKTYVDSENAAQNTIIASNKTDADNKINSTNQTVADNKASQADIDSAQNTVIDSKVSQTDFADDQVRQDTLITSNTQTITTEVGRLDKKDGEQDELIATNNSQSIARDGIQNTELGRLEDVKADKSYVDAAGKHLQDQINTHATESSEAINRLDKKDGEQDELIASNNQDAIKRDKDTNDRITTEVGRLDEKDAEQDELIASNNQDAIERDGIQNAELGRLENVKADKSYVDAADKLLQDQINTHTTEASEAINRLDKKDQDQDELIATNNQDSIDRDNTTNDRITTEVGRLDEKDGEQDELIATNNSQSIARDKATNDRITEEVERIDGVDKAQDELIAKNNQDSINRDTTTNDRITEEVDRLDVKDSQQDALIASNKTDADGKIIDTNKRIDELNISAENNRAEQEARDAEQDRIINTKVDIEDFKADQIRQDTALKAESERIDEVNKITNQTIVNNHANMSARVDGVVSDNNAKNEIQDGLITQNTQTITAHKAEQAAIDAAQNAITNTKVNTIDFVADQKRQDAALKAESERLDAKNAAQDTLIGKNTHNIAINTDDITNLKKVDARLEATITVNDRTINERLDKVVNTQGLVDAEQNRMIAENTNRFEGLSDRVNSLDSALSSGIASAMALSAMPTMSEAGAHMITGGSGYFNGSSAVAVGLTGTTEDGKYSYKAGGTYTKEGGSGFSIGGGYRWK